MGRQSKVKDGYGRTLSQAHAQTHASPGEGVRVIVNSSSSSRRPIPWDAHRATTVAEWKACVREKSTSHIALRTSHCRAQRLCGERYPSMEALLEHLEPGIVEPVWDSSWVQFLEELSTPTSSVADGSEASDSSAKNGGSKRKRDSSEEAMTVMNVDVLKRKEKNRKSAKESRERKKQAMAEATERVKLLELQLLQQGNLLVMANQEIANLRKELASLNTGARKGDLANAYLVKDLSSLPIKKTPFTPFLQSHQPRLPYPGQKSKVKSKTVNFDFCTLMHSCFCNI